MTRPQDEEREPCALGIGGDVDAIMQLSEYLADIGVALRVCADSAEALAYIHHEQPPLILVGANVAEVGAATFVEHAARLNPRAMIVLLAGSSGKVVSQAQASSAAIVLPTPLTRKAVWSLAEAAFGLSSSFTGGQRAIA